MLTFTPPKALVLRDYQHEAIDALRDGIRQGMKRQVLVAPTGAGKTVVASHLLREADRKGSYALFLVDRVSLVDQTSATLSDYGIPHGVVQADHPRWEPRMNVQVCSIQTLAKRQLPRIPNLAIYDECFPGDVEVLTSLGFKRFDGLTGDEDFAQYEMGTEAIRFGPASRMVRRRANGDVYRIQSSRRINLMVTGGHELVVHSPAKGWHKVRVDDFRPGFKNMPVAGFAHGPDQDVSPLERFMIAYQADGSLHLTRNDGGSIAAFSFSKERKVRALLDLVRRAGFDVTEVKPQSNGSANAKPRRRFMVSLPFVPTKQVWTYFDLSSLSSKKAAALLEEAVRWDGHVLKRRDTNWLISTTCRRTADFYQALAALGGMRATLAKVEDDRSEAFSDCFRVNIVSNRWTIGCQGLRPKPVEYDGDVYCVTVPTGCIVIRHHGKTIIVGNCHVRYAATMRYLAGMPDCVKVGLTATPFTAGMADDWDRAVNVRTSRALIDEGHLIEPKMYIAKSPDDASLGLNSYGEFSDESATRAGIQIVGDVVMEWVTKTREHFGGPVKTIVFAATVEHGRELCAAFNAAGFNFQQISYMDKDDGERREKIAEFRRPDSMIHGLVSCGVLTRGFDVTDVQCGISCRPYRKSLSSHLQEIGRVMRPHGEGKRAIWLCHSGNLERFGLDMFDVWDNGAGELSAATKRDSKPRERNQTERAKVVCPECSGAMRGITCMACGYEKPARSGVHAVEGELVEFSMAAAMEPRAGLRAECLKDPRKIWEAALYYTMERTRKGEDHARRWAYGAFRGVYPNSKLPFGWFDMKVPAACDRSAYDLIHREQLRFRKGRAA